MEKRIILDYIMSLMLFPLMLKPLNGIYAHEIMGIAFVLLTVIHCLNNKGWLGNIGKSIQKKDNSFKKIVALKAIPFFERHQGDMKETGGFLFYTN